MIASRFFPLSFSVGAAVLALAALFDSACSDPRAPETELDTTEQQVLADAQPFAPNPPQTVPLEFGCCHERTFEGLCDGKGTCVRTRASRSEDVFFAESSKDVCYALMPNDWCSIRTRGGRTRPAPRGTRCMRTDVIAWTAYASCDLCGA